jgi:uncharacterized protein (TIGR00369 family)
MNTRHEVEEILAIITRRVPFNRVLGLAVESLNLDHASLRLTMREELIGNFVRGALHGGVISSTLDFMGCLVAFLSVLKTMRGQPVPAMGERFAKIGTIDLRIDYLRPGIGKHFIATGYVLRTGNKVAVTRMELHNDEQHLPSGQAPTLWLDDRSVALKSSPPLEGQSCSAGWRAPG